MLLIPPLGTISLLEGWGWGWFLAYAGHWFLRMVAAGGVLSLMRQAGDFFAVVLGERFLFLLLLPQGPFFSLSNYLFIMNQYLAILIGGLIPMMLGYVWYHPKVFGGAWMKSLGFTEESMKQGNMGLIFGLSILCSLFLAWRMNAYSSHTEPGMSQFVHGFFHGAYSMGLPAALVLVSNGLFQRNTMNNLLINAVYWIVALGLMGSFLYSVATPEAPPPAQ